MLQSMVKTTFIFSLKIMIAPRWGLDGMAYYKPRAALGAIDLRTFGA